MTDEQKAKRKASIDAYRARNKEKLAAKAKEAYWADPEKAKAKSAKYHAENPEKIKALKKAWDIKNAEKRTVARAERTIRDKEKAQAAWVVWYGKNKKKVKDAADRRNLEFPGKKKEAFAKWYRENSEEQRARARKYTAANYKVVRERQSAYRKANPEKGRVHCQNRRARKLEAGGELSRGLAARLFNLQKGKCPCCKQPLGKDYHLDHKMPLALGGANTDDNMQLLRARCNMQKRAKHPVDFMQERGFLL